MHHKKALELVNCVINDKPTSYPVAALPDLAVLQDVLLELIKLVVDTLNRNIDPKSYRVRFNMQDAFDAAMYIFRIGETPNNFLNLNSLDDDDKAELAENDLPLTAEMISINQRLSSLLTIALYFGLPDPARHATVALRDATIAAAADPDHVRCIVDNYLHKRYGSGQVIGGPLNLRFDSSTGYYIYQCPHCEDYIETDKEQLNCKIFRHGVFRKNGKQLPPHSKKNVCDQAKAKGLIYGCGKPYRITKNQSQLAVEVCGYI